MKDKSLRVLMVEDSEDDVLLIISKLKRGGYHPVYERVETAAAMKKALKAKQWDIILCDYKMPGFSAPSAIALLKESNINIPLIIISGAIGEETAVECMRLGAQDYIMKSNLSRLCPAIARELEDAEVKKKQMQMEEKLRAEEQRFRALVEYSSDIIVVMNLQGTITYINPAIEKVLGFKVEERIGNTGFELIHPDDLKSLSDKFNTLVKSTTPIVIQFEMRLRHKDGSWRMVEGIGRNLIQNNVVEAIIVNYRDVTTRKQAEETLKESENKYRLSFENVSDVIFMIDTDLNISSISPSMERILGYKPQDFIGRSVSDIGNIILTPESFKPAVANTSLILKGESISSVIHGFIAKDGTIKFGELSGSPIMQKGKIIGMISIARDITDHKRAEEALRKNEERYRKAETVGHVGNWEYDPQTTQFWGSDEAKRIYGFDPAQDDFSTDEVDNCIPEIERVHQALLDLIESGKEYNLEYEIHPGNSSEPRIISSIAELQRDEYGNPLKVIGVIQDITGRKRAEEELVWKTAFLEAQVEATIDGILVVDSEGKIILTNQHLLDMWKVPQHIRDDRDDTPLLQYVTSINKYPEKFIEKVKYLYDHPNETSRDEIEFKDGMVLDRYSSPVLDKDGKYYGRIWTFRDISERKRNEDSLRKRQEELSIKSRNLEEMNTALKVLLKQREEDRTQIEENVLTNVKASIFPYIEKLKKGSLTEYQRTFLKILEGKMKEIILPFLRNLSQPSFNLTPQELRVADLVKSGNTTKEIADILGISMRTVDCHRESLRRKLGIKNNKTNLRSFLMKI